MKNWWKMDPRIRFNIICLIILFLFLCVWIWRTEGMEVIQRTTGIQDCMMCEAGNCTGCHNLIIEDTGGYNIREISRNLFNSVDVEIRKKRKEKLYRLKMYYLTVLVEDSQDGTTFDCEVIDVINKLEEDFG